MPIEHKLQRCENDDPHRCQSIGKNGQCPYLAVEGYQYCQRHAGMSIAAKEKSNTNRYRLQVWQERLDEFSQDTKITCLRDEIGILRILLEQIIIKCQDSAQLLIYSNKISDLTIKIEKLVTSCNRLDMRMGMLLDKSAALNFAGQVVETISKYITDPEIIDQISNDIINSLSKLTEKE